MNGAIFFASKYGSTAEYAGWISVATGLPVFDARDANVDPTRYDFLVLGSPVYYYKPVIRKWLRRNLARLKDKPIIMFTVSGAPAGQKLDGWLSASLPSDFVSRMHHVALRGRQNPKDLNWFDRIMLTIGGLMNRDPVARREELKGFDFMDRTSIEPVVTLVRQFQSSKQSLPKQADHSR
jgi:menaquinone-dependent protoporphyrinogen IX oxidase